MPTNPNMVAIETVTVPSGGAASIEFTSIPQTYTDLKIVCSTRSDSPNVYEYNAIRFNGNSSAIYTQRHVRGSGATATSGTDTNVTAIPSQMGTGGGATSNTFSNTEFYIPNYTSSNNKSVSIDSVGENNGTFAYAGLNAAIWASSDSITSATIFPLDGPNFVQYSTATLYGVTSAGYGAKATGGIITSDADYIYHTFFASGTFTPTQSITADYLVVAGGGGGGCNHGGGGAGGLRSTVTATGGGGSLESPLSLTAQAYTVTIGAGGAGAHFTNRANVTSGSNSVFSTITSTGGGYGANDNRNPATGGSGGGGAKVNSVDTNGASGTANQGYAGGNPGNNGAILNGGGGGGANAVGGNGNSGTNVGGAGGAGVATSITGSSVTYAGGGGGSSQTGTPGSGGLGGGGAAGAIEGVATSGSANTGGGGGASAGGSGTSGSGGSGIVIVRYAK